MPSEWNLNGFPHVLAVTGREATANPTTTNDFIVNFSSFSAELNLDYLADVTLLPFSL